MNGDLHDDDLTPESYADLAALAKSLTDEDARLDTPPTDLWARIEQSIRVTDVPAPTPLAPRRPRSGRVSRTVLGIAAAVVVVAGIGAVAVATRDDDTTKVTDVALANTDLDPRGASSQGTATLVRLDNGGYALDVDVTGLPAEADDYYELWVIDTNVEGMVSLGPLHGNGRYDLPPNVDPAAYPVVDISIEPLDGKPTHSGDSILRGILGT
jgi:anti-sigma-K factor RskA